MIFVCLLLIWLILLQFYTRDSYVYDNVNILKGGRISLNQTGAMLSFLYLIKPVKFIAAIGVKPLGIYIISGYVFQYVIMRQEFPATGYIMNFVQAVIITAVCYALSEAISRVKILNRIFFGGR